MLFLKFNPVNNLESSDDCEPDSPCVKRFQIKDEEKSILEILSSHHQNSLADGSTIELKMRVPQSDEIRYLQLQLSVMTLQKEEFRVATFHDETKAKALQKLEVQSQLMNRLQSSVKHEMITPLKCISGFAKTIEQELAIRGSSRSRDAHMVYVTS